MTKKAKADTPKTPLVIPSNEPAERAILGAIMIGGVECYTRAAGSVDGGDFFSEPNRLIFEACGVLAETGTDPDLVTITAQLERDGKLKAAEGTGYVASLVEGNPDPVNVEHYAGIVSACARKRHMLFYAQKLLAATGGENGNSNTGLAELEAELATMFERDRLLGRVTGGPHLLARLGVRCLSEVSTAAPPPLLVSRLDPLGHTIIFGTGDVGKGVLASHYAVKLTLAGETVLIADYEAHDTEWSRRISDLGGPLALAKVFHVAPLTPAWKGKRGAIWDQAVALRAAAEEVKATVLIVDSIIPACGGMDPMKPETTSLYAGALQLIGRPTLSLAHINRSGDQKYPFGSVFWFNLSRVCWSVTKASAAGGHSIILTSRKHNNYGNLGKFLVEVTWAENTLVEVRESDYTPALTDRIADVLANADGPLTAVEVTRALNEDLEEGAEEFNAVSVRKALNRGTEPTARHPQRFTVTGRLKDARYSNV